MGDIRLIHGDCLDVLRGLPDASVDAVVTDPPYGISFMGKEWDAPGRATRATTTAADKAENPYGRSRAEIGAYGKDAVTVSRAFGEWCELWASECLRVLKPGGHLLAFGGTRTWHRLACAVEDAGFEIRDSIAWLYGSGFPKSLDVSKAIDKAARGVPQGGADPTSPNHGRFRTTTTEGKRWEGDSGQSYGAGGSRFLAEAGTESGSDTERAASGDAAIVAEAEPWQGWGTALKPAFEPIVVARKPLGGTVAANVLAYGTGALNVDGCRIEGEPRPLMARIRTGEKRGAEFTPEGGTGTGELTTAGRWPANVVLDESQADALDQMSGTLTSGRLDRAGITAENGIYGKAPAVRQGIYEPDQGGASRFFYVAKADASERVRVPKVTHAFTEDVADYSMCACGLPALGHPDPEPAAAIAHPTVKPLALMRWLVRLVTPPGGTVLEPFAGSGTTVEACILEGFACIAIEREADYLPLIQQRIDRRRDPVAAVKAQGEDGGLFDLLDPDP